jgi:hypothetical protein
MAFEKKFELLLHVPENWEVTGPMADSWEKGLHDVAADIKDKLDERLPDDGTFERELVNPSTTAYGPMINPAFVSKRERTAGNIKSTRYTNLVNSFIRWKDNLAKAFATVDGVVAKFFKDKVSAAKDRWALKAGAGILRFTGDKIRGRSVAPITAYFLVGEERATGWVTPSELVGGDPYNIALTGGRSALKAAILSRLIQGGMMITNAGPDAAAEILRQNTINATILSGLRDPAKADAFVATPAADKCFCSWETDVEGRLILHTQVGLTV